MYFARSLHRLTTIIQIIAIVIRGVILHPIIILIIAPIIIHVHTHLQAAALLQAVVLHLAAVLFQDPQEVVEINLTKTLTNSLLGDGRL